MYLKAITRRVDNTMTNRKTTRQSTVSNYCDRKTFDMMISALPNEMN